MAIFKVKFARFARKHAIPDVVLWMAAQDVLVGAFEADLGGGVYKKRVARNGAGKPGGKSLAIWVGRRSGRPSTPANSWRSVMKREKAWRHETRH